jgi:type I restriction enzyme M protein
MRFFSKITCGIYDDAFRGSYEATGTWPADAAAITDAQHAALMAGQAQGKRIVAGPSGPVLQDPPPPLFADQQAAELADFRSKREAYLNRVAGIGFAAQQAGDAVTVDAAVTVRQGLLDIPSYPTVTAATDIDSLKYAIRARYAQIVGGLPAEAKEAFRKVDQ